MSGANRGGVGKNISGPYIVINGVGPTTIITDVAGNGFAIEASDGIDVYVTNVTLQAPSAGYCVFSQNSAIVQLGNVTLAGGGATSVGVHDEGYGMTEVAAGSTITLTGTFADFVANGVTGYFELDPGGGSVVCSSCAIVQNVYYLDGNANVLIGQGWTMTGFGAVAARPYAISGNSTIVNLAGITIPGTGAGWVMTGGLVDPEPSVVSAASTGLGAGATAIKVATARGGTIEMTAGAGASASGDLTIVPAEYLLPNTNITTVPAACTASVQDGATGTWSAGTAKIHASTFGSLVIQWANTGALTNGQDYWVTYVCGG
jgi:hypothetical protein